MSHAGEMKWGHLEQPLEVVDRLLRLAREDVDPHELVQVVGSEVRVSRIASSPRPGEASVTPSTACGAGRRGSLP